MAEVQTNKLSGELSQRFVEFVMMHAQNAALFLGQIPNPQTGEGEVNLDLARMFIDQLSMIQEKTRGNLTTEESTVLRNTLTNLQMAFVEVSQSGAGGTAARPQKAPSPATSEPTATAHRRKSPLQAQRQTPRLQRPKANRARNSPRATDRRSAVEGDAPVIVPGALCRASGGYAVVANRRLLRRRTRILAFGGLIRRRRGVLQLASSFFFLLPLLLQLFATLFAGVVWSRHGVNLDRHRCFSDHSLTPVAPQLFELRAQD